MARNLFGVFQGNKPFSNDFGKNSLKKQIQSMISNRPEYAISPEYSDNVAMAKQAAFGRDRSIQQQESNIEQDAANTAGQLGDVSTSTSGQLAALMDIYSNKNRSLRDLGGTEAALQQQKLGNLFNANTAMAEERDKAWNYNVNQPYQLKLNELVQRRKARQENIWKALDTATSLGANLFKSNNGGGSPAGYNPYDYSGQNIFNVG